MNATNFKLIAETLIADHLEKIENGEIKMTVSNQFDASMCEEALEGIKNEDILNDAVQLFKDVPVESLAAMDLACYISSWTPEPIDNAWID